MAGATSPCPLNRQIPVRSEYLSERLSHLPQEVLGELDGFVYGEIQTAVTDVLLNPTRKFPAFVSTCVTLSTANSC